MQRIRTEILPGVWLTALRTEKFKTAWLSVNLLTQLRRETAACTAVLPYVLRRGCTRLPDLEAIAAELDGLYGAHITPVVHKLGEIQAVGFEADFADDGALGEEIFPWLAADVADLLLHPNTRGGLLRPDIVDSERTQLIARIRAAVNNKRSYARERLYTHMCCCEDFAVPRPGEEADAERIHYRKLTMRYHDLLSTSPVEIFYCGSIDGKRVARILTDVLVTMPRGALDEDIGTDIRMNALEEQPRYVTETLPVAQAQLAVGYRLGTCMEDPDLPVLFVLNALYGGCVTSKLFLNLRERLSLCYSVGTWAEVFDAVQNGDARFGVLPFENSSAGDVSAVLDLLYTHPQITVADMCDLPIRQDLVALPGAKIEDIRTVISHPQALAQSNVFLQQHAFTLQPWGNTADAARHVAEQNDPTLAAVASAETAQLYGLQVLAAGINAEGDNTTRFIVIERSETPPALTGEGQRLALLFTARHKPGQLAAVLDQIGARGFNMECIKSRPLPHVPFEYYFYVQLVCPAGSRAQDCRDLLNTLTAACSTLRLLGAFTLGG